MARFITEDCRKIIHAKARFLQLELWNERKKIWKSNTPVSPMDAIDPAVALNYLGFDIESRPTNGEIWIDGKRSEPAGIIDCSAKKVYVSNRFGHLQQRYTLGHELGHAVLKHSLEPLHRDMPINEFGGWKNIIEQEADAFSAYFLMPEKPLRKIFVETFGVASFELDEDSAFLLCSTSLNNVQGKYRTTRALSRALAETNSYGRPINSLKSRFGVSTTAMAIRLEELKLVA